MILLRLSLDSPIGMLNPISIFAKLVSYGLFARCSSFLYSHPIDSALRPVRVRAQAEKMFTFVQIFLNFVSLDFGLVPFAIQRQRILGIASDRTLYRLQQAMKGGAMI